MRQLRDADSLPLSRRIRHGKLDNNMRLWPRPNNATRKSVGIPSLAPRKRFRVIRMKGLLRRAFPERIGEVLAAIRGENRGGPNIQHNGRGHPQTPAAQTSWRQLSRCRWRFSCLTSYGGATMRLASEAFRNMSRLTLGNRAPMGLLQVPPPRPYASQRLPLPEPRKHELDGHISAEPAMWTDNQREAQQERWGTAENFRSMLESNRSPTSSLRRERTSSQVPHSPRCPHGCTKMCLPFARCRCWLASPTGRFCATHCTRSC